MLQFIQYLCLIITVKLIFLLTQIFFSLLFLCTTTTAMKKAQEEFRQNIFHLAFVFLFIILHNGRKL